MSNTKLKCIFSCPIDTFSGYGSRARDFAKSLIKVKGDEWDIKFMSQRWGNCPFGALDENDPEEKDILDRILPPGNIPYQPDIWLQHSVSNEFYPIGKVNIGISALTESTILPGEMLEGLNRMHFNIVSSEYVKATAANTGYQKEENGKTVKVSLNRPVEVLFEGVNTNIFKRLKESTFDLSMVKEEFCFLTVAHWLQGDQGEDRKQLTTLIKSFLEAFKGKKSKPALILKTSLAGFSIIEREMILDRIDAIRKSVDGDLPNIYFLYGELTNEEMNELYNHPKIKAFALVGNEGFGRPYLEFSAATSKPIISSPFSGHMDFLHGDFNVFVSGKIDQVHPSAVNNFIIKESSWFKADPLSVSKTLEEVHKNYNKYVEMGKRQGHISRTDFSLDKMTEKLAIILEKNMPKMSRPVAISLPKLKTFTPDKSIDEIEYLEEIK
jgi:glycosyltransferase involved in cell wall biosynthesis